MFTQILAHNSTTLSITFLILVLKNRTDLLLFLFLLVIFLRRLGIANYMVKNSPTYITTHPMFIKYKKNQMPALRSVYNIFKALINLKPVHFGRTAQSCLKWKTVRKQVRMIHQSIFGPSS